MKLPYFLITIIDHFSASKYLIKRKQVLIKYFNQDFENWNQTNHYWPVSDSSTLKSLLREDLQHINSLLCSSSVTIKTIPISDLNIMKVTPNTWCQLTNEFFEKLGYSFSYERTYVRIWYKVADGVDNPRFL